MLYTSELNTVKDLERLCWSGASDTLEELSYREIEKLINCLEEVFIDEVPTETAINDFIWFERDFIAQYLGYNDFDEIMKNNK